MLDFIKNSGTFSISHSKYLKGSENLFNMIKIKTKSVIKKRDITIMFSDIVDAARLWEDYPNSMHNAMCRSNHVQKKLLKDLHGHKMLFNKAHNSKSSFCMAFDQATNAIEWYMTVQKQLIGEDWPEDLL